MYALHWQALRAGAGAKATPAPTPDPAALEFQRLGGNGGDSGGRIDITPGTIIVVQYGIEAGGNIDHIYIKGNNGKVKEGGGLNMRGDRFEVKTAITRVKVWIGTFWLTNVLKGIAFWDGEQQHIFGRNDNKFTHVDTGDIVVHSIQIFSGAVVDAIGICYTR
jgi:hypothetical protein